MDAENRTEVFSEIWGRLCKRFNRPVDGDEADAYLRFLEAAGLTTDEVIAGGESCWATREFFPRPADFLGAQASAGWVAASRWAREWSPTMDPELARELTAALSPRTKRALEAIGGIDTLREGKGSTLFARTAFFDAFERTVLEDAQARVAARALDDMVIKIGDAGGVLRLPSAIGTGPEVGIGGSDDFTITKSATPHLRVGSAERVQVVVPPR